MFFRKRRVKLQNSSEAEATGGGPADWTGVWFIIIRKESKHPVHQVRRLLFPGERERDQGLKMLIIVQLIERYKMLSENSIGIPSWPGTDQVQDLRGHFLPKNSYHVVELRLANCNAFDHKLRVCLSKPDFGCVWPENG